MIKSNQYKNLLIALLSLAITSCLEPYNPPAISETIDLLVVDGFINISDNSAIEICQRPHQSRTMTGTFRSQMQRLELRMKRWRYSLVEEADGIYALANMDLSFQKNIALPLSEEMGRNTSLTTLNSNKLLPLIASPGLPQRDETV